MEVSLAQTSEMRKNKNRETLFSESREKGGKQFTIGRKVSEECHEMDIQGSYTQGLYFQRERRGEIY
jgi:hypothetical protein